jgi:hypothetical protein
LQCSTAIRLSAVKDDITFDPKNTTLMMQKERSRRTQSSEIRDAVERVTWEL